MKVTTYFKSGMHQIFIVPADIQVTEFRQMAEKVGGAILRIEFDSSRSRNHQCSLGKGSI